MFEHVPFTQRLKTCFKSESTARSVNSMTPTRGGHLLCILPNLTHQKHGGKLPAPAEGKSYSGHFFSKHKIVLVSG